MCMPKLCSYLTVRTEGNMDPSTFAGAGDTNSDSHSSLGMGKSGKEASSGPPRILVHTACALDKMIRRNEKWLKTSKRKDAVTIFHGSKAPALSIQQYLERIFKYSGCSASCFVMAYIYIERFLEQTGGCLVSLNVHRLLITSVVIASKFIDDAGINNAYFAKVGGISNAEMNRMEVNFLFTVDFRLHVSTEVFEKYRMHLENEGNDDHPNDRAVRSCTISRGWLKKEAKFTSTPGGLSCSAI